MIRPYPISIEWPPAALAAHRHRSTQCREAVGRRFNLLPEARITVGIERFDYTKGILDRMKAIDELLNRQPSWKGRLVFIQAAAPTRSKLAAYSALQKEAERLADDINARHGSGSSSRSSSSSAITSPMRSSSCSARPMCASSRACTTA